MMKKLIALVLALSLLALGAAATAGETEYANRLEKILAEGKLTMATSPDYPPYEFIDLTKSGQESYVGSDIELGKYIAEQLGVELVIEAMDFDTVLAAVGEGGVDIAIAGMVPKEERLTIMDFSSVFNSDGDQVVVILADKADEYKALADLSGKVVAAQNGTLQYDLVTGQIPEVTCELITAIPTGIMMLKSGKVDAIALASVVADQYILNYPELAILEEKFVYESMGTVAGVVKGEPELLAAINAIVEEAEASGKYAQWRAAAQELASSQMG